MPFGEDGCQISEEARKRFNAMFGPAQPLDELYVARHHAELESLSDQLSALRENGEIKQIAITADREAYMDKLRQAYAEKNI